MYLQQLTFTLKRDSKTTKQQHHTSQTILVPLLIPKNITDRGQIYSKQKPFMILSRYTN